MAEKTKKEIVDIIVKESDYFLDYLEARVEALGIPEEYEEAVYGLIVKRMLSAIYYAKDEEQVEKVTKHLIDGILEEINEMKELEKLEE